MHGIDLMVSCNRIEMSTTIQLVVTADKWSVLIPSENKGGTLHLQLRWVQVGAGLLFIKNITVKWLCKMDCKHSQADR